jgi:hypothetical protein
MAGAGPDLTSIELVYTDPLFGGINDMQLCLALPHMCWRGLVTYTPSIGKKHAAIL